MKDLEDLADTLVVLCDVKREQKGNDKSDNLTVQKGGKHTKSSPVGQKPTEIKFGFGNRA